MVEEKGIEPHVPIFDKTRRKDGTFERESFQWDQEANEYRCPGGKTMRSDWRPYTNPRTHITKTDTVIYRASLNDCSECALKNQCCPNMPFRKIARSVHENARDEARRIATTPQFKQSRKERKKAEMLFAHLKRILKLDRLRLRGLSGAQDEFLLAATAQNLRRMAKRLAPSNGSLNATVDWCRGRGQKSPHSPHAPTQRSASLVPARPAQSVARPEFFNRIQLRRDVAVATSPMTGVGSQGDDRRRCAPHRSARFG